MKSPNKSNAFTLIELLVVIAIIGILVVIAVPSYKAYTRRAHFTEVVTAVAPFKASIEECFQTTGSLSDCSAGRNGVLTSIKRGQGSNLVKSISVRSGVISVIPTNKYGIISKDTYILTPTVHHGKLNWMTSGGAVEQGYAN